MDGVATAEAYAEEVFDEDSMSFKLQGNRMAAG